MQETTTEGAPKRAPWGKRIAIVVGAIVLLLVIAFFVVTSSGFIKSVILPKVGASINATVTADSVKLSPFSSADIQGLRVQTTGTEPLLTAARAYVRYSLMDILKGNIKVDEVTLETPIIQVIREADGTSNLDPILNSSKGDSSKPKSNERTRLSVHNVALKNGTVRQIAKSKDGSVASTSIEGLNLTLDQLGNGQKGKLTVAASFQMKQQQGGTNSVLAGNIAGGYEIALNQQLLPDTVKGSTKLTVTEGQGSFGDMAGFSGSLDADLTPREIKEVALKFAKGDQALGQVRVSGPLDLEKKEGTLNIQILSLDKNTLALVTAGKGYEFGNSLINSTNQVTISQAGAFFSARGNLAGTQISFKQGEAATPEMNLNADYQATVNTSDKSAVLERLNIRGESGGKPFLLTQLDRPMNLSWGETVNGYKDAALRLIVTNFNIADWRAIAGTNLDSGIVNASVALLAQQDGRLLKTDIAADIKNLSGQFGTNALQNAGVTLNASGTVEQLKTVNIPTYSLTLSQEDRPVLKAGGSARYSLDTRETAAQLTADGSLPQLIVLANMPDASAQAGTVKVTANYNDVSGRRTAVGTFALAEFTGKFQTYSFTNFALAAEYNVAIQNQELTVNQTTLAFKQAFNPGGSVDLKGNYNLDTKAGQFTFKIADLNQNTLGPVLATSLGENQLVSISVNGGGEANLNPKTESSVKVDINIDKWLVQDKAGTLPKTPLAVALKIDGGMKEQLLDLRQFLVQLTPTDRAKNSLEIKGKLDLSKVSPSTVSIRSESFDATPYYNMFASSTNSAAGPTTPAQANAPAIATTEPAGPSQEPAPISLPFEQFTADVKIDRFYLREIAISNWVATVSIRSNIVSLQPFQLGLNGGSMDISGTVDVGVPGYKYDLALKADQVPLAPLANSLGSGGTNQLQGNLLAQANIHGAGTTGPNLRKNLGGNATINLTNLNYQVVGPKLQRIVVPISLALRIPELTQTPINWVSAQTVIGNGVVNLEHLGVESGAFYAESSGPITLADVLTNSTLNLPVDLSILYALAEKSGLVPSGTPTNARYAKLPRFVTIKGTVGAPETDINKLALAGMLARGAASFGLGNANVEKSLGAVGDLLSGNKGTNSAGGTNSPAANLIQGVTGLLGGKQSTTNNAPADTNKSSASSLFQGLSGLLGGRPAPGAATNSAGTTNATTTNAPAANPAAGLLDSLFRGRQNKPSQ